MRGCLNFFLARVVVLKFFFSVPTRSDTFPQESSSSYTSKSFYYTVILTNNNIKKCWKKTNSLVDRSKGQWEHLKTSFLDITQSQKFLACKILIVHWVTWSLFSTDMSSGWKMSLSELKFYFKSRILQFYFNCNFFCDLRDFIAQPFRCICFDFEVTPISEPSLEVEVCISTSVLSSMWLNHSSPKTWCKK